ncbi:uncharacterized protein LOC131644174 isoform X2 [Vicia villosa]|uniref:uncharacterized protein LOC131644174 isoform X2 n=1 Tax=Vicia villosa TaxID=3911 RepID=UPI00273B632E|nr:uncharacterized protein LOC131644174 isoform X2 [Vicia villosa]
MEDISKYAHSPVHVAVLSSDHASLRRLVSVVPNLPKPGEVTTESQSLAAEIQADKVSSVIDRRDVPGRETPLHLAVRLRDPISAEILMSAGADWSLQNEQGWSALQEAVCNREESIALVIARHYQPLAWAKWCRRLPRIIASASRIRDFYMEISFHFESSVIPFIGRIAPSDTYRIWKRGSNLRADMTLAGFDGFRIQRADQSFLFLGEGYASEDGSVNLPCGSLLALSHKEKEVTNALEGAGAQPTDAEVAREVSMMFQTNMYRPGIDVTQAELVPNLNWRRQEKTEIVGDWKARVYDMLNVMVSVKSRRVPGALNDEEAFANGEGYDDVLTAEERIQLDSALRMGNSDGVCQDEEPGGGEGFDGRENVYDNSEVNGVVKGKKGWFGWNKKSLKNGGDEHEDSKKFSVLGQEGSNQRSSDQQNLQPDFQNEDHGDKNSKRGKDQNQKKKKKKGASKESKSESEFKRGVRPVLWLTQDFPLKIDELLPLLDILANKVKAIRRLRELLTTKLPQGTFPVKVAIPIVPTIRVIITFTKFEEHQTSEEFSTPPTSPVYFQDPKSKESEGSTSWISWMKGNRGVLSSDSDSHSHSHSHRYKDGVDPFIIPSDYKWVDASERKRRMKAKRAKSKKNKKQTASKGGDGAQQGSDEVGELNQ